MECIKGYGWRRVVTIGVWWLAWWGWGQQDGTVQDEIEFWVNGEAVSKRFLIEGIEQANRCAPEVCPTDPMTGREIRRNRLIRLLPMRQFLDREGIEVRNDEIDARIQEMERHPNPFGVSPPKPLAHVMVRQCLPMEDLRLLVRIELGMQKWALREWERRWGKAQAWESYCTEKRTAWEERCGKFRRLWFSLEQWPAGARDEDEAMERLKERAEKAWQAMEEAERFQPVADGAVRAGEARLSESAVILPYDFWGPEQVARIRGLKVGKFSEPIRTRFGWEIVLREAITDEDVRAALKADFLKQCREDMETRITREAEVRKGPSWTQQGE